MAYKSKIVVDRALSGPTDMGEYTLAVTIPPGATYTTVALGGATNNCAYLAFLRGENGDGLGAPTKIAGTGVIAYINQVNIAAPSALLSQFSEYGNWTANTNLDSPLIKITAATATNSYAGFDKNGVCLGINSTAATVTALPGFAKLVTIWAQPVLVDDATVVASTVNKTVTCSFSRNANAVVAGSNILRYYPYQVTVNANDRVGTAGKA